MPRLENWALVSGPREPHQAPETNIKLYGQVYDHPNHADGNFVTTSRLVGVDGDMVVSNSGRCYTLGKVDPGYEKAYPNARERILKQGVNDEN